MEKYRKIYRIDIIIAKILKKIIKKIKYQLFEKKNDEKRKKAFTNFTKKYITNTDFVIKPDENKKDLNDKYDYFIVGSDQVWNPKWRLNSNDLLKFADGNKRISFSASIGVNEIPKEREMELSEELKKFKNISVREDRAKEIIEKLTNRQDVEVLVDPTMLLTDKEWDKIAKKPEYEVPDKYILTYFLGGLSKERKKQITSFAKENKYEIIDVIDKKSLFYGIGPSEFLYLEKNASLICTDSFHSAVFAIIYNRPFLVFDREGGSTNMGSRLDTLLRKFDLNNSRYNGKITIECLKQDYTNSYKILDRERKKSIDFLCNSLQ